MQDTEPIAGVSDLIRSLPPYRPRRIEPDEVRATLMELLGIDALPDAPAATWDDPVIEDDVRVTRGRFRNALDEVAPIAVCRPSPAHGAPPPAGRPAILCLPGSRGDAEVLIHHRLHRKDPERGPLYGWARELARRGCVTLSLSARGCGPRYDRQRWIREANCMRPRGRSQMGYVVLEALQALALLADLDGVDTARVGVTGFSAGGQSTWYAAALAPEIAAAGRRGGGRGAPGGGVWGGGAGRPPPRPLIAGGGPAKS
ncbi:MAG: acetylxylan esterase, partial [Spirochaetaceae bacterium]|nr:acetylxylan esterase [Spirochaetaceae bacterium]